MAKQRNCFPEDSNPGGRGRKAKYDWTKLFNGKIWELLYNQDYFAPKGYKTGKCCKSKIETAFYNKYQQIKQAGKKRGFLIEIRRTNDFRKLYFQATKKI